MEMHVSGFVLTRDIAMLCYLSSDFVSLLHGHDILCCFVTSGTIGHVAHGKSTVVKAISGVQV
jgi:hypothetical protein